MSREKVGFVYILSNWRGNVLYIGVTADLMRRIWEHKFQPSDSFAWRYRVNKLLYYEQFGGIEPAISREKQLKNYSRTRKINLIKNFNPDMIDLSPNGQSLLRAASRPSF